MCLKTVYFWPNHYYYYYYENFHYTQTLLNYNYIFKLGKKNIKCFSGIFFRNFFEQNAFFVQKTMYPSNFWKFPTFSTRCNKLTNKMSATDNLRKLLNVNTGNAIKIFKAV